MTEEITYYINTDCINCGLCVKACPEHCIDVYKKPAVIDQSKCDIVEPVQKFVHRGQSEIGTSK